MNQLKRLLRLVERFRVSELALRIDGRAVACSTLLALSSFQAHPTIIFIVAVLAEFHALVRRRPP